MDSRNADTVRADDGPTDSEDRRHVAVEGRERIAVPGPERLPRATITCTVECASGERDADAWTGVPVPALAEAADFPGATTHLHVEADDFAAQVPVRAALDGVLAFDRGSGDRDGLPRFVAPGVPGERLVKRVRRVAAVELAAGEDPYVD